MTEQELFNTPQAKAQAAKSKKKAARSATKLKPSDEVYAVINGLEYLTPETIKILKQRAQEWFDEWPLGEPMYCRNDGYQFVIHANQVAQLFQISLRQAQDVLQANRITLGKGSNDYVSVKEFCKLNKQDEEDCRRALRDIPKNYSSD